MLRRSNRSAAAGASAASAVIGAARRSRAKRWSRSGRGPIWVPPARLLVPLAVKRGYHLHLAPHGNAVAQPSGARCRQGFVLAPMNRGIRLTTGSEFAAAMRRAVAGPGRVGAAGARRLFPLGEPVDASRGWGAAMPARHAAGDRPAPRHAGLWFDFGHQHHGLTPGPADRPAARRDDDRQEAVRRSGSVCGRTFWLIIFAD